MYLIEAIRSSVAPFTQRSCIIATMVVHQLSAVGHSHRAKPLLSVTVHAMMMMFVCLQGVSTVSPCQSKPVDNLKSYGFCYNVLWLKSWPIKRPRKCQSYIFRSKFYNYVTSISEQDTVWHHHLQGGRLFSEGKFTEVSVWRADHCSVFFPTEIWRRVGRIDWRTDASLHISAVFFSSYKLPKTVTFTMLRYYGHVTLLCGTFVFNYLSEGPV